MSMAAPVVYTFKWGIFDVAYEATTYSFVPAVPPLAILRTLRDPGALLWRFLKDVYNMAPLTFSAYVAASTWLSISPAFSLYVLHIVLQKVRAAQKAGACDSEYPD